MIGKRGALKYGLNNNRRLELRITVEFETKPNANTNIMQPQNIDFQNVSGNLIQETKKFMVSLENNAEDVIEVLRSIWELSSLSDGYFYKPCKYNVDGIDVNVEKLYFLSFYDCKTESGKRRSRQRF